MTYQNLVIGVLALQGDVREHIATLEHLGAKTVAVKSPQQLAGLDGIILPGGESTVIEKLLKTFELFEPLRKQLAAGLPVFGTCAGMILLADEILDGTAGQETLGGIPMSVRRNAFGRQVDSAETVLEWVPDHQKITAVFIRAPWVESFHDDVEVLAYDQEQVNEGRVVAVRYLNKMATSFHPEINKEPRIHQYFLDLVQENQRGKTDGGPFQMGDN